MTNERKPARVLELLLPAHAMRGHRRGWLVGIDDDGRPQVDYPGNPHGPLWAEMTIPLSLPDAEYAIENKQAVLLCFESELSDRPVVIGLLRDRLDAPSESHVSAGEAPLEVSSDGKRVTLEANDEIMIRCGEASITLRRNGRLVIRGVYVESRAKGTHRIKGGSVQIN